jgi:hypothetical protein
MLTSGIFEQLGRFGIEKRQERRSEGPFRVSPGQYAFVFKTLRNVLTEFVLSGVRAAQLRAIL